MDNTKELCNKMKSSNIISNGNIGLNKGITHKEINLLGEWKVDLTYIKSNSDGGFPAGFNSMEVGRN